MSIQHSSLNVHQRIISMNQSMNHCIHNDIHNTQLWDMGGVKKVEMMMDMMVMIRNELDNVETFKIDNKNLWYGMRGM